MSDTAKLRDFLKGVAWNRRTVTYREAAQELALAPPNTIHQVAMMLESLMEADAKDGVPLISSLVISQVRAGVPAPGFFVKARELGVYDGQDSGEEAAAFHRKELDRVFDYWG